MVYHPLQTGGLNDIFEYVEIHLQSTHRDKGSNDQPIFTLRPAIHNVLGVKLIGAQIPSGFPNIIEGHNVFYLERYVDGSLVGSTTYTIPPGLYNAQQLCDTVSPLMASEGFSLHFNPNTARFYFQFTGIIIGATREIRMGSDSPSLTLGFPMGQHLFDFPSPTITAPLPAHIHPNTLYLISSSLSMRVNEHVRVNGSTTPNPAAIASIPNNVNNFEVIHYNDPAPGYFYDVGNHTLDNIDLTLIDSHTLLPLSLVDLPWSVTIACLVQRDTSLARNTNSNDGHAKRLRIQ